MAILTNNTGSRHMYNTYDTYYQEYILPDGRRVSEAEYRYYRDKERYYMDLREKERLHQMMCSPPPLLVDAAALKAAQASHATDPLAFLKSNNTKLLLTGETA